MTALRVSAVAVAVVAVDALTKWLAQEELREPVEVVPGFQLDLSFNSGVAFGMLRDLPGPLLIGGLALVIALLVVAAARGWISPPWPVAGLLIGGAVANLVDRAGDGRVTDFLDPVRWPAFNVADVAITVGVGLLLLAELRRPAAATTAARP